MSSFPVSDVTDEHNICLGLFTKLLSRVSSLFVPHERYIPCFLQPTSRDYCCVTFVSIFINLRHPWDFTSHPSRRGTLYYYVRSINVFFCTSALFLFRPWVFSRALCSVARREPARTPHASLGPGRGPRHVLWGSKWQVPSGRDSEHVEPSRPLQTHIQVKIVSDVSCDIWDLECHQCRQTILDDGKVFPRHQDARHATTFNTCLLYTSPSPRDLSTSRMPSSA